MANLEALSNVTTTMTGLSNLILVTPSQTIGYQAQNAPEEDGTPSTQQQPPAFLFDFEGEQVISIESDITDHYIEDNTAIQDQIALKPVMYNTHGYIGELNDISPLALKGLKTVADKLFVISSYVPALSVTAQVAYNNAFQLYQVGVNAINSAVAAVSSINGSGPETTIINGTSISKRSNQNKQQTAFQLFYGYWASRTLFTIQTPWAIFQNMALKSLRAIQDPETRVITDFEVSFKQIRTAQTITSLPQSSKSQKRLGEQSSALTDLGVSTPPTSIGLSDGLAANFSGLF